MCTMNHIWIICRRLRYLWFMNHMSIVCRCFVIIEVHMYFKVYKSSTHDWHNSWIIYISIAYVSQLPIYDSHELYVHEMIDKCVRYDSFIRATWLIHTCDMTRLYVRHGPFIRATWLIHTCKVPYRRLSYVTHSNEPCQKHMNKWCRTFICVTALIDMRDMTLSYVCYYSIICATRLIHMCFGSISDVAQMNEWFHTRK